MIQAKLNHCKTLEEFYYSIVEQQKKAHGERYCDHHDAIIKYLKKDGVYKELGTHQGATAAAAILRKPKRVELVDFKMNLYRENENLFNEYAKTHNIEILLVESNSLDKSTVSTVDVLFVDSDHKPEHLKKELALHSPHTKQYMIFHDTAKPNDRLYKTLVEFCKENPWNILENNKQGHGHTVLQRINT